MKGENRVNKLMPRFSYRIVTIICGGLLLSGCVMAEKYDAEKARSLNFQRLLAQEEKRTGELDSEVKRSRNELMEYEARNRELTAQVQVVSGTIGSCARRSRGHEGICVVGPQSQSRYEAQGQTDAQGSAG